MITTTTVANEKHPVYIFFLIKKLYKNLGYLL